MDVSRSVVALLERPVEDLLAGVVAGRPGLVGTAREGEEQLVGGEGDTVERVDPLAVPLPLVDDRADGLGQRSRVVERTCRRATYVGTCSSSILSRVA